MTTVTLEEVVHLAEQLRPDEQAALVVRLQLKLRQSPPLTFESIMAEFERRKASGAFENAEILRNKYANPDFDVSAEQLLKDIHEAATEWESEIDEFYGDH